MAEENITDLVIELRQEIERLKLELEKYRKRIIELIDSYDATLKKPELANEYRQAFQKVRADLIRAVKALGLDAIDPKPGDPFDDVLHKIEGENRAPGADLALVHQVVRTGFRVGSEVIRPCEVIVGYAPEAAGELQAPAPSPSPSHAPSPRSSGRDGVKAKPSAAMFENWSEAANRNRESTLEKYA